MTQTYEARDTRNGGGAAKQQRRPAWALPLGLGIGLLSVGGFFVLVAHGLSVLAAIG